MNKFFTVIFIFFFKLPFLSPDFYCKGKILDSSDDEPLIGATVKINYNNLGTTTNFDGDFKFENVQNGNYLLTVSYIGYLEQIIEVKLNNDIVRIPNIKLVSNNISLSELEVIADIAKERVTPVAATTISAKYIEEENLGNQEFPEILRNTPSVYVTKEGGGFFWRFKN